MQVIYFIVIEIVNEKQNYSSLTDENKMTKQKKLLIKIK